MSSKKGSPWLRRLTAWGFIPLVLCVLVAAGIREVGLGSIDSDCAQQAPVDARVAGGSLMIVGGGAVTPAIRREFVELAGGREARIVLIPASDLSPGGEERLLSPWQSSGAASVTILNARDRQMADDPAFCAPLKEATGVWFGGGYQALLAERYVDTLVQDELHRLLARNGVVGGCSAGAALLSRIMIREGDVTPVEARGLDLISDAIVDQHFLARNRVWRLEQMLEAHPKLVGLGIDEATALVIDLRSWRMRVVGESYVFAWIPGSEGHLPRIEILHPGDDVVLSQLREQHLVYHPPVDLATVSGGE
jgi:cyanophycinase